MLGLGDGWIFSAYLLCIASALLCIVYGVIMWNNGGSEDRETPEQLHWEEKEIEIEKPL